MNLRDLEYFVAIADYRHFGKAAKACFVSQPSLSIQIKKLEVQLGIELIERTSRSVLLTDIGKAIAEQARVLLQQAAAIKEIAKSAHDPLSGQLNLGVISTLTAYLLPLVMPELIKTESFPKLSIYLAEQSDVELLANVKQGKLDAAFVSLPVMNEDLVVQPLFKEELMLAVPRNHSLARKKTIKPEDLDEKTLLLLEEGHCLRDQTFALFQQSPAYETNNFSATNLEILRHMVCFNGGMTVMPRLACYPNEQLRYLSFGTPKPTRTIGLIWRTTTPKKILLSKLVAHIKRLLMYQPGVTVIKN